MQAEMWGYFALRRAGSICACAHQALPCKSKAFRVTLILPVL